jgi:urease subunit alpha
MQKTCVTFVSQAAYDLKVHEKYGLNRIVAPVRQTRTLTKEHMVRNNVVPNIDVNPETFAVTVDGVHATVTPPKTISLNQLYFFS